MNDGLYCPGCKQVILDALSFVPRKLERVWVETTEVPVATLFEWVRADEEDRKVRFARGELVAQRLSTPLFNLITGESDISGFVKGRPPFEPTLYQYRYWRGKEGEMVIRKEIDRPVQLDVPPTVWERLDEDPEG